MTSYVKMIDIWMIFTMSVPFIEVEKNNKKQKHKTMSVPFIEVGLHAGYEVLKRRQCSPRRVAPGSVAILKGYLDLL